MIDIIFFPTRSIGLPDWLVLTVAVLYFLYRYGTSTYDHWEKRGIPSETPSIPFIGNLPHGFKYGMIGSDEVLYPKHGSMWGTFLGRKPLLIVADPTLVKQICVKEFSHFANHMTANLPVAPAAEKFLTALKDDEWRSMRNVVTPTFSGAKMKALAPTIVDCAVDMTRIIEKRVANGEEFECKDVVGIYTMNAVGATLFGFNVNALDEHSQFTVRAKEAFAESQNKWKLLLLMFCSMIPGMTRLCKSLGLYFFGGSESWKFFASCVEHLMHARRTGEESAKKRVDFLALLLDAHELVDDQHPVDRPEQKWSQVDKRALTHQEIVSNAMMFFLAGYETTAAATSLGFYLLALNEQKQELLREEIDRVWEENNGNFSFDLINSMAYLDAVVNETLRLYPPATRTDRVCASDCTIDGIQFKAGDWLMISIWALHHSDKHWEKPLEFRPERFLPENKDRIKPYSFMPFGIGPRHCIGQRLAYLEAKIALIYAVRHFTLHRNAKTEVPLVLKKASNLTGALNGIYLDLKKRDL